MPSSDDRVVDGAEYVIELQCGDHTTTWRLRSETYALLMEAWKRAEGQRGRRLEFTDFLETTLNTVCRR